jgi:hypothetical protein
MVFQKDIVSRLDGRNQCILAVAPAAWLPDPRSADYHQSVHLTREIDADDGLMRYKADVVKIRPHWSTENNAFKNKLSPDLGVMLGALAAVDALRLSRSRNSQGVELFIAVTGDENEALLERATETALKFTQNRVKLRWRLANKPQRSRASATHQT